MVRSLGGKRREEEGGGGRRREEREEEEEKEKHTRIDLREKTETGGSRRPVILS